MDDVELLLRRYGDDLDEECSPVTLAELERRMESTAEESSAIGLGLADDAVADGVGDRRLRLMVLAAAVVVLLVATVAVVVAVVDGDEDSNRVITEQPDTPVTVETPATTVVPSVTEAPSPTTEVPPPTASPAVAEWSRAPFAPPPEYGYPLGGLSCCVPVAAKYRFILLGSPGTLGDPFSGGDLLVMLTAGVNASIGSREGDQHAVRGTTGYSGRYVDFPPVGFVGELTWREEDLGVVVLASRSFTTEELVEIADSLSLDEASLGAGFEVPDGYAAIADQWYADRLGPLSLGRFDEGLLVPNGPTYISTWTTGGVVEQRIRVTAKPASPGALELVAYLVTDASRVPVGGATGVLGTYGESKQLSWIDDQGVMVTIVATDPSVDLVAMADSEPPAPWSQGPGQTVLTGTREGRTWSLRVVPDAQRGYDVCWELGGADVVTFSECAGGAVWFNGVGFAPLPIDGYGFFVGGAVPSCAAQVRSGSRTIATVEGTDGRRYFGTWDLNPQALLDPGTLEALDEAGATVGTWSRRGTWRDDRC